MDEHRKDLTIDRILIVGVGGLGVPAAIGLGQLSRTLVLGLLDPEKIELSNLTRQIIYSTSDIGKAKVTAAARFLADAYPELMFETMPFRLDSSNARELIAEYDCVFDCTDDPATKFLLNDTCVENAKPFIYGGALGFAGQAMTVLPHETACLRCVFEEAPPEADAASCRDAGILGPVVGAIGMIQASEAGRLISGDRPQLAGKLLTYDAANVSKFRIVEVSPRAGCICGAARSRELGEARKPV